MLGYEIAELIGQQAHSTMHHTRPDGTAYPQSECPIYATLNDGLVHHVTDEVFWRKDGTSFPVEYVSTPLRDKDGAIIGATVVFSDITERKRSQAELRQSEHRFREMLENLNLIAIMVDTQCRLTFCNDYLLRLTGWKHEEVIGCDWIEKFIPCSDATIKEMFFSNIHTGKVPVHYENTIKTKNGDERLIAWNNTMFRDAEGNVSGVAAVGEDVTESRRAAERIAEQAALLDKTQDAIVVCNLEGRILFWSKGAERLYGFTGEEALGQKSAELIYDGREKYDEAFAATLAGGEWTGELQQSTKDGRKLTVESRWALVRDAQGNRKSIMAINTDVTERKKIEAHFLRAQRMESIGTLAGGVAHDLNNILAPIMMSIDILRDMTDDPEKKHILKTIEASAQRGSDIVRQILSFARGVEGKRIEVQPKHLLKEMEHIVRNTFPKNIRLEATFPPEPWTIIGDPTQIHQILLNLCVNARDAMPEGGTLLIGAENCSIDAHYAAMNPDAKVGDYVCLSVADTGTGMPPSVIDKIFDPFFTTKEMGLGTGLGLSTVLAIVKSHGGFLKVDSEPAKGTTFRIYLPAAPAGGSESAEEARQAALLRGHGETVLIVDDEESILTITRQTLQTFEYEVLTANNGAEAVAIYAQHRDKIAVVLTDMMMPVMDGRATIHALRQINPVVKIIAASGVNAKADASTTSDAGVKTFLSKPYSAETLLKTLRTVLDNA